MWAQWKGTWMIFKVFFITESIIRALVFHIHKWQCDSSAQAKHCLHYTNKIYMRKNKQERKSLGIQIQVKVIGKKTDWTSEWAVFVDLSLENTRTFNFKSGKVLGKTPSKTHQAKPYTMEAFSQTIFGVWGGCWFNLYTIKSVHGSRWIIR